MEANLHSGEANNKNLGYLENVSNMNLLFRILRTRFLMFAVSGNSMWARSKRRIWDPVNPPGSTFGCSWSTFEHFFWPQSGSDPIQSRTVDPWVHWVWSDHWLSARLDLKSPKCYSFVTLISRWVCLRILNCTGWTSVTLVLPQSLVEFACGSSNALVGIDLRFGTRPNLESLRHILIFFI